MPSPLFRNRKLGTVSLVTKASMCAVVVVVGERDAHALADVRQRCRRAPETSSNVPSPLLRYSRFGRPWKNRGWQ